MQIFWNGDFRAKPGKIEYAEQLLRTFVEEFGKLC